MDIAKTLKGKKVAIDDVVNSYSNRLASHKASWPNLMRNKLLYLGIECDVLEKKSDINEYDAWLIVLPMEFQGSFNVFGGAKDELAIRLKKFIDFKGEIYVLDQKMPDIGAFIKSRKSSCSDLFMELDHDAFTKRSKAIKTLSSHLNSETFILGDSHSISVYQPGSDISRNDGKTLFGALKSGLQSFLPENKINKLIVYFGNIDIRHHLYRQKDLKESVYSILEDYERQLRALSIKRIIVVGALHIESEERKLPKTGYHEGTPFYGSAKNRSQLVKWWNLYLQAMCKDNEWEYIGWPDSMLNENGTLDFKYMEKPKSVHLSREFYHYDFDVVTPGVINESFLKLFK